MNRRFLTLLFLLIVGLALWFTSRWWLPWLLDQLPRIEANSDLIQAIEALVNIAWLLFSAVIGYLLWLSRPGAKPQTDRDLQDAILTQVSVARLLEELGRGANLNWIDRGAVRLADLQLCGRVVITGRSGQGKSREAIELIRRAVEDDLVLSDRIFRPGPALRFVPPEVIASQLARSFDPHPPALLYVDDLPYYFTGEGLIRVSQLIDGLSRAKALYVVAVARIDQLTPEHRTWLEQERFNSYTLPNLSSDGIAQFVDSAASEWEVLMPADVRAIFVERSDGTPQHPLTAVRLLSTQDRAPISADGARSALSDSAVQAWAKTRLYIIDPQRAPAAAYILDALAHFHVARLTAYRSLVIPYAAHLARAANAPRRQRSRRTLERALTYLGKFDIRTAQRVILYRDEVAALAPVDDTVLDQLAAFLSRHRRIVQRLLWRISASKASEHRTALLELGNVYDDQDRLEDAIASYRRAITLDTEYATSYNNLGLIYRHLGRYEEAVTILQRGIASSPKDADLHISLGNVYYSMDRTAEAIVAYRKATTLDPKDAYPYNNLGNVYYDLGRYSEAIAVYKQAIELDPNFASPHNGLGNVHSDLGNIEEAITAYKRAIDLDPEFAYPYNGLGNVYYQVGRVQEAIAPFERATVLDPRDAYAHNGLGNVFRSLNRTTEAIAVYLRAIELDPKFAFPYVSLAGIYRKLDDQAYRTFVTLARPLMAEVDDEYARAWFACICGDVEQALKLLRAAITKAPGMKMLAKRDPDFDFIRNNPRFQALVNDQDGESIMIDALTSSAATRAFRRL